MRIFSRYNAQLKKTEEKRFVVLFCRAQNGDFCLLRLYGGASGPIASLVG